MKNNKQSVGDLGQHWTPIDVVKMMLSLKQNNGITLEPSAGSGRFVAEIPDCIAVEIDKNVVPEKFKSQYVISNFFSVSTLLKANSIIGNPPYVAGKLLTDDWFAGWKGDLPITANAYLHIIEKCLEHLLPGGEIIFIVPSTLLSGSSRGKELRQKMLDTGAFTHVIFCSDVDWETAAIDTLIFRWEKDKKQEKVITADGSLKNLYYCNGFIWLLDFEDQGSISDYFKATVGSAPSKVSTECFDTSHKHFAYMKEGKEVMICENETNLWPRVHHTPEIPKIYFISGPIRRWPVFHYGTNPKHLDHALIPKVKINVPKATVILNDWFKKNGEKLNLIIGGRWAVGVKEIEACPIDQELKQKLDKICINNCTFEF